MNTHRITMKDVALRAKVSVMTVSRVLRNDPSISEVTRKRIAQLAEQMGYKKDPLLSALVSYRRKEALTHVNLGYIDDFRKRDGSRKSGSHREYFQGALERAEEIGYKLDYIELIKPGINPRRATQILLARNIQGLILAPRPRARSHMHLEWKHFSVVALNHTLHKPEFHLVSENYYHAMILAVRKLRALGYRRIGLAMSFTRSAREDHLHLAGFLVEQERLRKSDRIPPYLWEDFFNAKNRFDRWFETYSPQVIIGGSMSLQKHLIKMGIKIPERIGLVCLGKAEGMLHWSGIEQPSKLVGRMAVDFLLELLQKRERGIPAQRQCLLVDCSWVEGKMLRRINRKEPLEV